MNNQFILNNEPGKQCHLENLGSILVFESLVWPCHSDAEGHHPSHGAQAMASRQPRGGLETTQADFSGSGVSLAPVFWEPILRPPMSLTTELCRKTVSAQLWGLRTYLKATFVGFLSSVHWVPSLDCSCPGATRSLEGGILPSSS